MQTRTLTGTALAVASVLVAWATTATPAAAKAVSKLEACGANACRTTKDQRTLRLLIDIGDPEPAPPRAQRTLWFRMVMTVTWEAGPGQQGLDRWVMRYYPAAGMMRDHRVWVQLPDATTARFDGLTRGLEAHGAAPSTAASTPAVLTGRDSPASSGGGVDATAVASAVAAAGLIGGAVIVRRRHQTRPGRRRG